MLRSLHSLATMSWGMFMRGQERKGGGCGFWNLVPGRRCKARSGSITSHKLSENKMNTGQSENQLSVEELERAVTRLSSEELKAFSHWFSGYVERDWQEWDRQIEEDYEAGKLDGLIKKAKEDYRAGRTEEL